MDSWDAIASRVLEGDSPTAAEALAILDSDTETLLPLLQAAFRVRSRYFGRLVQVHLLHNAKSGRCSENCQFCSQSAHHRADIETYEMQSVEELVVGARRALDSGAATYCMVTAARGPVDKELAVVCDATRRIKAETPLRVCVSLGLLTADQAAVLAAAGVDRVNHNLETSRRFFPSICQTHGYEDRLATVRAVKAAGMEACCGGIIGMGETLQDRVALAFDLRDLRVESIPVNFFNPRPGTPLEKTEPLGPHDGLRALAMFRLVNPRADLRVAGGREVCLRQLQALALYPASSIFTSGYLTTDGQTPNQDLQMIADAGFEVVPVG